MYPAFGEDIVIVWKCINCGKKGTVRADIEGRRTAIKVATDVHEDLSPHCTGPVRILEGVKE